MFHLGFGSTLLWNHSSLIHTLPKSSSPSSSFLSYINKEKLLSNFPFTVTESYLVLSWPLWGLLKENLNTGSLTQLVRNSLVMCQHCFSMDCHCHFVFQSYLCLCVCVFVLRHPFNPDACSHSCCFHSSVCTSVSDNKHSSGRVWALMSLSLVAASLLSWNNARDMRVQWWNHIHLYRGFIKLT